MRLWRHTRVLVVVAALVGCSGYEGPPDVRCTSPDGRWVALCSHEATTVGFGRAGIVTRWIVVRWRSTERELTEQTVRIKRQSWWRLVQYDPPPPANPDHCEFSPDGSVLTVRAGSAGWQIDVETGKRKRLPAEYPSEPGRPRPRPGSN